MCLLNKLVQDTESPVSITFIMKKSSQSHYFNIVAYQLVKVLRWHLSFSELTSQFINLLFQLNSIFQVWQQLDSFIPPSRKFFQPDPIVTSSTFGFTAYEQQFIKPLRDMHQVELTFVTKLVDLLATLEIQILSNETQDPLSVFSLQYQIVYNMKTETKEAL